jgi:hypothetical protein
MVAASAGAGHAATVDGVVADTASVRQQSPGTSFGTAETVVVRNDVVYGIAENVIQDDAWVRTTTPTANYGTTANLVIGKGGHAYFRLDVSAIDEADLSAVVLNLTKYNNAADVTAVRAGEFLSNGGAATTTRWSETSVTWNTRPLDVPGSPVARASVAQGNTNVPLDVTELVKDAKADAAEALTIHITTEKVDDLNVAGTDIYSTRATNPLTVPWVEVSHTTDVVAVDYPVAQRFADYRTNAHTAQDVVRIAAGDGRYLTVNDATGAIGLTSVADEAGLFAVYGYDYTASEYAGTGGGQQTTYAIRSLTNDKFLTIQNYGTAGDQPYYNKAESNYVVSATAPVVAWNERFSLTGTPDTGQYMILSHLNSLRDGAEGATSPTRMTDTAMVITPGDRQTHWYGFESVDTELLEVHQSVAGTSARLTWMPVAGDQDAAHYRVDGGTGVTVSDGVLTATVDGLAAGEHTITVSYDDGSDVLTDDVRVRVFSHPGVSLTTEQLTAMRDRIAAKAEPWYSDYLRMKNTVPNSLASLDFQVVARAGVGRGTPAGSGNIKDYEYSSAAAYFHALQWVITGDARHADKVVEILNAWSSTLTQIDGRDQILGAGLSTLKLINAAEIVRYYDGGYTGYADEDFASFQKLMRNVVYPVIQDAGAPMIANGNWDGAAIVAVEAIGVITDDAAIFDEATSMYQSPYINGSLENYVTDWGQIQESARDQAHAQLGIGLMADVSTIAGNQGVDLWSLDDNKLARAFNWVAEYNLFHGEGTLRAEPVENVFGRTDANAYWDEMDEQSILRGQLRPVYEAALAHYSKVDGVDVTWLARAAKAMRPQGLVHFDNLNFDTLTMYDGEPTAEPTPYFQLRTMLAPWYQRTWPEVAKWGTVLQSDRALQDGGVLPAGYTTETLESYFAVQPDGTMALGAMQEDAPYFRLVTNPDETYSIQEVSTGRFLGVAATVVDGKNVITAASLVAGDAEKFQLRTTGLGRYYLVHGGRLVEATVEGSVDAPRDATVALRLGTQPETLSTNTTPVNALLFSYGDADTIDKASVTAHDSSITTADSWNPVDNLEAATDQAGDEVTDLTQIAVSGTVDVTTPGAYPITYHSGTASATVMVTVVAATAPTVAITSGGGTVSRAAPLRVSGTADAGNTGWGAAGAKITVEIRNAKGAVALTGEAAVDASGAWSSTLNVSKVPAGSYVIAAIATSRGGGAAKAEAALRLKK